MGLYRVRNEQNDLTGLSPKPMGKRTKIICSVYRKEAIIRQILWACMKANEAKKLLDLKKLHEAKMDNVMGM